ncbi:MAG: PEGA domain-containing protein [Deltaproteobacteria bacterium]|nr:PEGA domain-containing protein [Deltaproteobacteria bacterium]
MSGEIPDFPVRFGKFELLRALPPLGGRLRFEARLAGFQGPIDIRRLPPERRSDPQWARRFVEEGKLTTRIVHNSLVRPYELGIVEGDPSGPWSAAEPYIALELVEGIDLGSALVAAERHGIRLPIWFGPHVAIEALAGLSMVHALTDELGRPLMASHQRMSPSRVWLARSGHVKLDDVGSLLGPDAGEPGYRAPEQLEGRFDLRSDLFAVAVLLWECLTQRPLFAGLDPRIAPRDPPSRFNPDVPPELEACVLRALAGPPELRTPTAIAFATELSAILLRFRPPVAPFEMSSLVRALSGELDPRSIGLAVRGPPSSPPRPSLAPPSRPSAPPKPRIKIDDLDVPAPPRSASGGWSAIIEEAGSDPHESPTVAIAVDDPVKAAADGWGDLARRSEPPPRPTVRQPSETPEPVRSSSELFDPAREVSAPLELEDTEPPDKPSSSPSSSPSASEPPKLKLPVPEAPKVSPLKIAAPEAPPKAPNPLDFADHDLVTGAPRTFESSPLAPQKGPPIKLIALGVAAVAAVAIVFSVPGKPSSSSADGSIASNSADASPHIGVAAAIDAGIAEPPRPAEVDASEPVEATWNPILSVISKPSGAAVEVDGGFVGSTPLVLKHTFPVGKVVHIVVQADGHQAWSKDVQVDETGALSAYAELVAGSTRRVVTKPLEEEVAPE